MKTILEVINLGEEFLKKKGIERARREAEDLIAAVLGLKRIALYLDFERPLNVIELEKCREFFVRRGKKEPFEYIVGLLPFAHISIKVTQDVLIPRPETELLVTKIIAELEKEPLEGKILWDMCTGSGCIGIALKKRFPALKVVLSDISPKALQIASENARLNDVDVIIEEGDMFAPMREKKIDFFVANPPYVKESEYESLSCEIRQFEPKIAFIAGKEGLFFYQIMAHHLFHHLNDRAWLEIGSLQKESTLKLFMNSPWSHCFVEKDWAGKDRFLKLIKK